VGSKKKTHIGHRNSKSGEFVKPEYAKRHPATTQKESIPNPGRGDTGRRNGGTGSTGPRIKK